MSYVSSHPVPIATPGWDPDGGEAWMDSTLGAPKPSAPSSVEDSRNPDSLAACVCSAETQSTSWSVSGHSLQVPYLNIRLKYGLFIGEAVVGRGWLSSVLCQSPQGKHFL